MEEKNNEGNKFEFKDSEEQQEVMEELETTEEPNKEETPIEETTEEPVKEENDKSVNMKTLLKDSGEDTDTQLFSTQEMAIIRENLNDEKIDNKAFNKMYFGYKFRVALYTTISIICLIIGLFFIVKALKTTRIEKIQYTENADATYKICVKNDDPYLDNCLDYSEDFNAQDVKNIKVVLNYIANLEKNVNIDLVYQVMAINRIYDKFDSSKVLYENKDIIIKDASIDFDKLKTDIDNEFTIDFKKYYDFVQDYQDKYPYSSEANLEIVVSVLQGKESYEVGTINIPIDKENFKIYKNFVKQNRKEANVLLKDWTNKSTLYIIIGSILIIISIFTMTYLTKLVLATLDRKSKYEKELSNILTTYDRLIVEARGGYESDIIKKVIKVPNLEELLDIRELLDKPIIYAKVNNIKSEFIVEDEDKIYKFVLKEADIEK